MTEIGLAPGGRAERPELSEDEPSPNERMQFTGPALPLSMLQCPASRPGQLILVVSPLITGGDMAVKQPETTPPAREPSTLGCITRGTIGAVIAAIAGLATVIIAPSVFFIS